MNLMRRRWFVLMLLCGTLGSLEARGQTDGAALVDSRFSAKVTDQFGAIPG